MKVCMFTRSLPVHSIGGMELHIETLCKTLSKMDIDISIITTAHPAGIDFENNYDVKIYYLTNTKPGIYSKNWWKDSIEKFVRIHSIEKFDIVHSQSAGGYYFLKKKLNKKFNLPAIVSLHGTSIDEMRTKLRLGFNIKTLGLFKIIYNYFLWDRVYLANCDAVIATSERQIEVIKKYFPVNSEKLFLVYNGIDENLFIQKNPSINLYTQLNIKPQEKLILSIARLKKEKGIQNIVSVFPYVLEIFPDTKLIIIGDGEYKKELIHLSKKLKLNKKILFLGKIDYKVLPEYLNLCDIFVNSTIRENGYDLTVLQAMSCAKPVICSDIKSIFDVIENGKNGFIFQINNIENLKEKIVELLKNETLRKKIGATARNTILEKFSLKNMAEKTIEVYKKVLSKK